MSLFHISHTLGDRDLLLVVPPEAADVSGLRINPAKEPMQVVLPLTVDIRKNLSKSAMKSSIIFIFLRETLLGPWFKKDLFVSVPGSCPS